MSLFSSKLHVFGGQIYVIVISGPESGRSWQSFGDCRIPRKAFRERLFVKFRDKNAVFVNFRDKNSAFVNFGD